jgi:hypothetical protein
MCLQGEISHSIDQLSEIIAQIKTSSNQLILGGSC